MVEIRTQGKDYWVIAKRFHEHRDNQLMRPTAVRDMQRLLAETSSPAVRARIGTFIARHHREPGGNMPIGGGPRRA